MSDVGGAGLVGPEQDPEAVAEVADTSAQAGVQAGVLRSSGGMAVGTIVSRISGVMRDVLISAALGVGVLADTFTTANTLPNIIYILAVGGALNAVFVPQLVRHTRKDTDGGDGYADRLITLVGLVLLAVSAIAVLLAPWIVGLYGRSFSATDLEVSAAFARYCLPQILFYGVFTMLTQVLNSRGSFVAPAYAPVANNVVMSVAAVLFLRASGPDPTTASITSSEIALLGIGATLGVAVQAAVLVPVAWRVGYHWRPRFDFRGHGLGHAWRLARWTIAFVAVNQVTFLVIVNLANAANVLAQDDGGLSVGLTSYTRAHLLFILPHSVVTVSLAAALLPRMSASAAAGDVRAVSGDVASGLRTAAAFIVPTTAAFLVLGPRIAQVLTAYGNTSRAEAEQIGVVVQMFALGLVPFTIFYLCLRGYFAFEDTRTPFWLNVGLNVLNAGFALALFFAVPTAFKVPALALGYSLAYLVTAAVTWRRLGRRLGGLETHATVRTLVRLTLASVLACLPAYACAVALTDLLGNSNLATFVQVVAGLAVGGLVFVWLALRMRVTEVSELLQTLAGRVRR
ncbi:MAG TPA: murein biosynthesis integral membrane protein MurJ [Candidatus Limnocylindria bacterium]|nr:murein biosynthesis integral membrane protein MurJ [Candidatus Limnocylindria bacterium]